MCNVNFQKPQTNDELCQNILNISTEKSCYEINIGSIDLISYAQFIIQS